MHLNNCQHKLLKGSLLTSSVDWTVKLWNLTQSASPVFEFSTSVYDYISDVRWNPVNPALFSTVCSGGDVSLWHLGRSVVEPVESLKLQTENDARASNAGGALNRSAWSKDGEHLLVGTAKGSVQQLSVNEACLRITSNEESKLETCFHNNIASRASTGSGNSAQPATSVQAMSGSQSVTPALDEDL
jgi:WD40 repeat protein